MACMIDENNICSIREAHERTLVKDYSFYIDTINFKLYGSNSSRTRTLVIGVRKNLVQFISPAELFPNRCNEKTLHQVIGDLPSLKTMGEIDVYDIYHSFRSYPEYMRPWISDLSEGHTKVDPCVAFLYEKCRKMGAILVKTALIRVKVFREHDLSVS